MMKNVDLTVIVPRLPPSIDGLGDYGLSLARKMRQDFGIITKFIVGDPKWQGESVIDGFVVKKISKRDKGEILSLLSSEGPVLLHYVGYGYAKRGCPVWLIQALKSWKKNSNQKLITMFHECYAFGPIWTSQFWTSPLQRLLIRELSLLSSRCITSKKSYAEIVERYSNYIHTGVTVLPVFSNIGEPNEILPLSSREKTLVVFGSVGWRKRVYESGFHELKKVVRDLNISKVVDIGKNANLAVDLGENVKFETLGNLPAEEISQIFSHSLVGFFNYPSGYLSKSGIFASYCSHGLLPVGCWTEKQVSDGVIAGVHYLLANDVRAGQELSEYQKIADNCNSWYKAHNLSVHAQKFSEILD